MSPKQVKWALMVYVGVVIIGWIYAGAECMYKSDGNNFNFARMDVDCLWAIFWPLRIPCVLCQFVGAVIGLIARVLIKGVL